MTDLEFLAYILFGNYTFAEELAATFSERRASFLVEYMNGERFGFIYLLRYSEPEAIESIYRETACEPSAPREISELASTFRRARAEYAAVCFELNMEVLSSMREAGLWD